MNVLLYIWEKNKVQNHHMLGMVDVVIKKNVIEKT